MDYRVEFSKRAIRSLKPLSKDVQRQLIEIAESLSSNPRPDGCVAMTEVKGCYRIRQGDYRMVYTVCDDKLIVLILAFGDRKDIYKKSEIDILRKIISEWRSLS